MKEGLGGSERELSTSNARGRWTGFKAQTKDINGKDCVSLVPSVMHNFEIKVLKSFSVNITIIFRVRESVAAKSDKLPLNTFKFLSSVQLIITLLLLLLLLLLGLLLLLVIIIRGLEL